MKKKKKKIKFVPQVWWFEDEEKSDEGFVCIYSVGYADKYGLHYVPDKNGPEEQVPTTLKGNRFKRAPYAFNSYDDMINNCKATTRRDEMIESIGDIKKEAVYLSLDLDKNGVLLHDPSHCEGYVTKHGTVFNVTSNGDRYGKKRFRLTKEDKKFVFPSIEKAAAYVFENYGDWAGFHYLKNHS